jgi:3-(3-hydroxy-phenyl)propionate hydroxylase
MSGFDCDLLVVGLGPVGAALAALLVQQDLSVIAVDKDVDVYPMPRAAHFDHEIMRLFQQLGVADEVLRHARVPPAYEFRNAAGEVLMRFELDHGPSPSGWPASFMFHQPGLENALRARVDAAPNADVRLGHRFVGLAQDAESVTAQVENADGERRTIRARYVIGCDGASSAVRGACGVALDDYQFDEPWLVVDVHVGADARLPTGNLQICDPAGPTTCVLMGPGRHRWEFMLRPDQTASDVLDDDYVRERLRPWGCADDVTIERKAVYRFHALVAKAWRQGRVLLAGDAAHQTPPFAGQGMCSGLRDAANLAWKLAAILRLGASEALLDTYQTEREPHTRALIERAIGMGRVVCTADPAQAAARDAALLADRRAGRQPPLPPPPDLGLGCLMTGAPGAGQLFPQPWAVADGQTLRLDDALGPGPWLISRLKPPVGPWPGPMLRIGLDDPRLAPFHARIGAWLDKRGADTVLVRPDRYVFGAGSADQLEHAFAGHMEAPVPSCLPHQRSGAPVAAPAPPA